MDSKITETEFLAFLAHLPRHRGVCYPILGGVEVYATLVMAGEAPLADDCAGVIETSSDEESYALCERLAAAGVAYPDGVPA